MNAQEQAARLEAVKRKSQHAPTILRLWIEGSEVSDGIPGRRLATTEDSRHHCRDCGKRRTLYCWINWPLICAWCSLARFENDGENPRIGERAEAIAQSTGGA